MKILIFIFILFLCFSSWGAETCKIKTFSKIIYADHFEQISVNDFITETTCPLEVQKKFKEILFSFKGVLYSEYLSKNFSEELSNFDVEIEPHKVEAISVNDFLKKKISLPKNWDFSEIRLLTNSQFLLLSSDETLTVTCSRCENSGNKNIEMMIVNSKTKTTKKEWVNANITITTKALVPKVSLSVTNQALNPSDFETKEVQSIRPERYFTNKEDLIFYKLNKPLAQGTPLENTDLTPINLVSSTRPAQVIIRDNDLTLSATAIPMRSGKMGDMIELRNPTSHKVILGKVIDYNKVLIEL